MKVNKKAFTFASFILGGMIFMTTAFADVALGSGYERLKDSIKLTAGQVSKGLESYTLEMLFTLKDNGNEVIQSSETSKVDRVNMASESSSINQHGSKETVSSLSYCDKYSRISKTSISDMYRLTEYPQGTNPCANFYTNPFEEKEADEIEKIFDAVVGSLKEDVQLIERPDGGKEYAGSISEAQVPALVNAVSSYFAKRIIRDCSRSGEEVLLPDIRSDIYIQKITGKAAENKSGLVENLVAEIVFTGKDDKGIQHDMSINIVAKLTDINKTVVSKPDLSGKKVEKVACGGWDSKYMGKYKNDIIMEKDDKLIKIGDRTLEINEISEKCISGRFYEAFKPGFEEYGADKYDFTFEYSPSDNQNSDTFTYVNSAGENELGQIHMAGRGKVYLNLNIEIDKNSVRTRGKVIKIPGVYFDSEMNMVFEN